MEAGFIKAILYIAAAGLLLFLLSPIFVVFVFIRRGKRIVGNNKNFKMIVIFSFCAWLLSAFVSSIWIVNLIDIFTFATLSFYIVFLCGLILNFLFRSFRKF